MKRATTILLILLFALISLARQALPEQSIWLRQQLLELVERGSDYGALAATLGRELREERPQERLMAAFGMDRGTEAQPEQTELPALEPAPGESL